MPRGATGGTGARRTFTGPVRLIPVPVPVSGFVRRVARAARVPARGRERCALAPAARHPLFAAAGRAAVRRRHRHRPRLELLRARPHDRQTCSRYCTLTPACSTTAFSFHFELSLLHTVVEDIWRIHVRVRTLNVMYGCTVI